MRERLRGGGTATGGATAAADDTGAGTQPEPESLDGMSEQQTLYRRFIRVLLVSQVLAPTGLAAGITVGALLAEACSAPRARRACPPRCSRWAPR